MSNKDLTGTERRFIEDVTRLMVPWGVPQTAARLYGYLLLSAEPVTSTASRATWKSARAAPASPRGCWSNTRSHAATARRQQTCLVRGVRQL